MLKTGKLLLSPSTFYQRALYSSETTAQIRIQQAFAVLGLEEDATIDDIKLRFSELAKRYHPDTGGEKANAEKLSQIRSSFKLVLRFKSDEPETEVEEVAEKIEHDIRYTAPQHRQYLEYGGIGIGNPSTRQKQYQHYRVYTAVENAADFMMEKALREDGSKNSLQLQKERSYFSKKHKLTGMIDRVVEELILSSMSSGDFANLKGSGKPLKYDYMNPYIDEAEKRINDIMKNNGFAPPWIMKESEIRADIECLRRRLREEYCRLQLTQIKDYPNIRAQTNPKGRWDKFQDQMKDHTSRTNTMIRDYNLTCPIVGRQFMGLKFDEELQKAMKFVDSEESEDLKREMREKLKKEDQYRASNHYQSTFWGFLKDSFRPNVAP